MQVRLLTILCVGLFYSCSTSQHQIDMPEELPVMEITTISTRDSTDTMLEGLFVNLLECTDSIVAFHLDEWTIDTTENAFSNYKKLNKRTLLQQHVDSLKNIVVNQENYVWDNVAKRCEFGPNLGFHIKKANEETVILIALNCNVIQVITNGQETLKEDCDPAHRKLVDLGNIIFPDAFNRFVSNTE